MAKKKTQIKEVILEDLVHTLSRTDIMEYVSEHPDCGITVNNICDYYTTQGYNVISI